MPRFLNGVIWLYWLTLLARARHHWTQLLTHPSLNNPSVCIMASADGHNPPGGEGREYVHM